MTCFISNSIKYSIKYLFIYTWTESLPNVTHCSLIITAHGNVLNECYMFRLWTRYNNSYLTKITINMSFLGLFFYHVYYFYRWPQNRPSKDLEALVPLSPLNLFNSKQQRLCPKTQNLLPEEALFLYEGMLGKYISKG